MVFKLGVTKNACTESNRMNTFSYCIFAVVCWSGAFSKCPSQSLSNTYRLIYTFPPNCNPNNCEYYLGIRTNDEDNEFLDFKMVGKAQGWIAVGFSLKPDMEDADVMSCAIDPSTRTVAIVDTYNVAGTHNNVRDTIQNVCPHMANFSDGRITCIFSRAINTGDPQDKDLNGDYYEQFAAVDNPAAIVSGNITLTYHGSQTPVISKSTVNPASTNGSISSSNLRVTLTRVHGILMIVAWPMLAVSGIFVAAWMKPVLPNGRWFQVHRAIMLLSLFAAAGGFLVIFVANKDYSTPGLIPLEKPLNIAHFVIGIIVMLLHITNPIVSIFRCKPTASRRWIFNLVHGSIIGFGCGTLALTNCGLGIALFSNIFARGPERYPILWLYIGFTVVILVIAAVVLRLRFTEEEKLFSIPIGHCLKYSPKDSAIEMMSPLLDKDSSTSPSMRHLIIRYGVMVAVVCTVALTLPVIPLLVLS